MHFLEERFQVSLKRTNLYDRYMNFLHVFQFIPAKISEDIQKTAIQDTWNTSKIDLSGDINRQFTPFIPISISHSIFCFFFRLILEILTFTVHFAMCVSLLTSEKFRQVLYRDWLLCNLIFFLSRIFVLLLYHERPYSTICSLRPD